MTVEMAKGSLYAVAGAMLFASVLSALITWKQRASCLIPVLLLALAIVTTRTHYYQSSIVLDALAFLRGLLAHTAWATQLGVVGGALVVVGLIPFLLTWKRSFSGTAGNFLESTSKLR